MAENESSDEEVSIRKLLNIKPEVRLANLTRASSKTLAAIIVGRDSLSMMKNGKMCDIGTASTAFLYRMWLVMMAGQVLGKRLKRHPSPDLINAMMRENAQKAKTFIKTHLKRAELQPELF